MPRTHFSGPITAGNIRDTSGTTVGTNVSNAGYVVMAQGAAITQSVTSTALPIVIPAYSAIISITTYAIVDFTGASNQYTIGISPAAGELTGSAQCANGTTTAAADNDTEATLWSNVGPKDVQIYVKADNAGTGKGYVAVQYAQGINFVEQ